MDLETEDRQRRLAELARDIVLQEAGSVSTWEDDSRWEEKSREKIFGSESPYYREVAQSNAEMAVFVAAARLKHAAEIKRLKLNKLERAQAVIDRYESRGWGIAPLWARNTVAHLQHLKEDDAASVEAEAIAAINAVLR